MSDEKWRALLGKIVEDEKTHKLLEADLKVSSITIDRWVSGESTPRMNNIRALLLAPSLSTYRDFHKALMEEYQIEQNETQEISKKIPPELYEFILKELSIRSTSLRKWGIIALCLNDMAIRLEANKYQASYIISQCSFIQEKHFLQEKYIFSYKNRITQQILAESRLDSLSLPSLATTLGHDIAYQIGQHDCLVTNQVSAENIKSSAAFILFRAGLIAGCFVVCSEDESYISSFYQHFETYTTLLSLAFSDKEFYAIDAIQSSNPEKDIY